MLVEAIYHQPKSNYAYAYDNKTLHIRVRTKRDDMNHVFLLYCDKYNFHETGFTRLEMQKFARNSLFDYYHTEIQPAHSRCAYLFEFTSGEEKVMMNEVGFVEQETDDTSVLFVTGLFEYPFLNPIDVSQPPAWVKDAIFYQIFPERFANGDNSNDPAYVHCWDEAMPSVDNFFGGDLQGVVDHLDYLVELGITAIYFTPIFEATTNHKYDTIDYLKVDRHFGTNEMFKFFVQTCHGRGIKVMLDAVFNHTGYFFAPFQDVVKNGEHSPFKNWFHIHEFPLTTEPKPNYMTFSFVSQMPKLNTEHPDVKKYLLEVARYWVEDIGIDGWRLDVANEVDHQFWREFRQVVKQANPDAYILGEIWHNSLPWLQGDQFDAVMNYPVTNTILDFFSKDAIDAETFMSRINTILVSYPLQANQVAFNLLDSHDTARLLSICNEDKRRMKLAVLFQMTYMGAPCIFYGDEVGMTGGNDPDCRKPMIWNEERQDRDLFKFYKRLIQLRKDHRALRDGSFTFLLADNSYKHIAYERADEREKFIIVLNNSGIVVEANLPSMAQDVVFGNGNIENGKVFVEPFEYAVLKQR